MENPGIDFAAVLGEQTLEKNIPDLSQKYNEDFAPEPEPEVETTKEPEDPEGKIHTPVKNVLDVDMQTEMAIEMLDSIIYIPSLLLARKRDKKKRFASDKDFRDCENTRFSNPDPEPLEPAKRLLWEKYKAHETKMEELSAKITLQESERESLKAPLQGVIEKAGMQIPPGLALTLTVSKIVSDRAIDIFFD